MSVTENDLTLRILREIQSTISTFEIRFLSLEEKLEVNNERLSLVERGVTFCAAQINVMRRHLGLMEKRIDDEISDVELRIASVEEAKTEDRIRDLQERVAKLEDLVKP